VELKSAPEGLFNRVAQMRETADHADNLFSPARGLDGSTIGPIAPDRKRGERTWSEGHLLPVLQYRVELQRGLSAMTYTYLHSLDGGRVLRKLTIEWSIIAAVTQEQINPMQLELMAQFEDVITAFFPLCDAPATNGVVVRAPHMLVVPEEGGGEVQTCRTPMHVMFVIDHETRASPSIPNAAGKRAGKVLLGPDGMPARR